MNHSRPALRASRIFYLPSERDHHQDAPQKPGPSVNVSPLAQPRGESGEVELRDCRSCGNRADCMQSVLRKGPFALEVCEQKTAKRRYALSGEYTGKGIRRRTDREALTAAIQQRKTFSAKDLWRDTGLHHSTITGHLSHMLQAGTIRHVGKDPHSPAIMYELVEEQ